MIEKLISIKGCLKIRKYEISRELSLFINKGQNY